MQNKTRMFGVGNKLDFCLQKCFHQSDMLADLLIMCSETFASNSYTTLVLSPSIICYKFKFIRLLEYQGMTDTDDSKLPHQSKLAYQVICAGSKLPWENVCIHTGGND